MQYDYTVLDINDKYISQPPSSCQVTCNLLKTIKKNYGHAVPINFDTIHKAIYYAKKYHKEQFRQSGEPYYHHTVETANILAEHYHETDMFVCAILHDTLEDTTLSRRTLKKEFGDIILNCVHLLTNANKETLEQRVSYIINNTNSDKPPRTGRTLAVKVADRLHNLRTLHVKSKEKQNRIASETRDILIPIAKELRMLPIAQEMQTICDKYLIV